MNKHLYTHSCHCCNRSYCSSDENKIYCSSSCESNINYRKRHPSQKKKKKEQPSTELTYSSIYSESKPDEIKKAIIKSNEKWLNRKALSAAEMKRRRRLNPAYRDMFKLFIPKSLKVMRG